MCVHVRASIHQLAKQRAFAHRILAFVQFSRSTERREIYWDKRYSHMHTFCISVYIRIVVSCLLVKHVPVYTGTPMHTQISIYIYIYIDTD